MTIIPNESVLENKTSKFFWDLEIQTDHRIRSTGPDLAVITKKEKKENLPSSGFWRYSIPQSENKRKRKNRKMLGPWRRITKTMEHASDDDTKWSWFAWNGPQRVGNGIELLRIARSVETIQTTPLLWSARILRRVLEIRRHLLVS